METNKDKNKRIAKNTFYLYFRMLFQMLVGLYTSRVVFNALGVIDYGLYNVVGGVVAMFGFINASMGVATRRYLTYEIGKASNPARMRQVFSTSILIHLGIAAIVLILAETIGLWYVFEELVYPPERQMAVICLYQISIITTLFSIWAVPYNSILVSHERMSAFAYISLYEVLCNLLIAYLVYYWKYDKLVLYAVLILVLKVSVRMVYGVYCKKHFSETSGKYLFDKKLFKEMVNFMFWIMNGCLSVVAYTQGLNLLLNAFFGPVVNAARGIAVTIQLKVNQFVYNFQTASMPQITKSYAAGDFSYMHSLIINSSKYSVFIVVLLGLPIYLECPFILKTWLGDSVPNISISFVRLTILVSLVETIKLPLSTAIQSTGKIKLFQIIEGTLLLFILPVSYLFLKNGHSAVTVFVVQIVFFVIAHIARICIVCPEISMSYSYYINSIIVKSIIVIAVASILPVFFEYSGYITNDVLKFFVVVVISVISTIVSICYIDLTKDVRKKIINLVLSKLNSK